MGESSLSREDQQFIKFVNKFEEEFITQDYDEDRDIIFTLNLGWKLLALLPKKELKRVKKDMIEKYLTQE